MPADICIRPSQNRENDLFCCFAGVSSSVTWRSYFTVLSLRLLAIRSTKAKLTLGGKNAIIGFIFKHLLETVNTVGLHPSALSCSVSWINLHFLPIKVTGKIPADYCMSSSI